MGVSCSNIGGTGPTTTSSLVVAPSDRDGGVVNDDTVHQSPYIIKNSNNHNNHKTITNPGSSSSCSGTSPSTNCSLDVPLIVVTPKTLPTDEKRKQQNHHQLHDESLFSSGTVSLAEFGQMYNHAQDRIDSRTATASSIADVVPESAAHCSFGDSVDSRHLSRTQSHTTPGSVAEDAPQQHAHTPRRRRQSSSVTDRSFSIAVPSSTTLVSKSEAKWKSVCSKGQGQAVTHDDDDDDDSAPQLSPLHSTSSNRACPAFATTHHHAKQLSEKSAANNHNNTTTTTTTATHALPLYPPISVMEKMPASDVSQRGLDVSAISHLYLADSHSHSQNTNSQPSLPSVTYPMYSNNNNINNSNIPGAFATSPRAHSALLPPMPHHTPHSTPPIMSPTTHVPVNSSHHVGGAPSQHRHTTSFYVVSPLTSYHGSPTASSVGQVHSNASSTKRASSRLFEALQSGGSSCMASGSVTPPMQPSVGRTDEGDSGDAFGVDSCSSVRHEAPTFAPLVFNVDVQEDTAATHTLQFKDNQSPTLSELEGDRGLVMSNTHSSSFSSSTLSTSGRRIKRKGGAGMMTPSSPAKPLTHPDPTEAEDIFSLNDPHNNGGGGINTEINLTETVIEVSYADSLDDGSVGSSMPRVMVPPSMGVLWPRGGLSRSAGVCEPPTPLNQSEMHCSGSPANPDDDDDNNDPLGGSAMPLAVSSSLHPTTTTMPSSCPLGSSKYNSDNDVDDDESNPLGTSHHQFDHDCEDYDADYAECSNLEELHKDEESDEDDEDDDDDGVHSSNLLKRLRLVSDSPTLLAAQLSTATASATTTTTMSFPKASPLLSTETTHHHQRQYTGIVAPAGLPPHTQVHRPHRISSDPVSPKIVVVVEQHHHQ